MIAAVMIPNRMDLSPSDVAVLCALWFFFTLAICGSVAAVIAIKVAYSIVAIPTLRIYRRFTQAWMYPTLISLNVYDWIVSKLGFGVKENS